MKENDFIVIQSPMVTQMGLSGNRLIVYALINGFCKDDGFAYRGGLDYICEWTRLTAPTAQSILKELVDEGLLFKTSDGSYTTIRPKAETDAPVAAKKEKSVKRKGDDKEALFEECWVAYRRKGSKKEAYKEWLKLEDSEKESVLRHIKIYVSSREIVYQRDFQGYLKHKLFTEIIVRRGEVLFDPAKTQSDAYQPEQSFLLSWDESRKINIYIGFWDGSIPDGYDDDNRPDGARVMLNNSRGIVEWCRAERKWIMK